MNFIELRLDNEEKNIIIQLQKFLGGTINEDNYEISLSFANAFGKGTIRLLNYDWGVSLTDYDVTFIEDTKLIYKTANETIVEFLFISEGKITYNNGIDNSEPVVLERYQNIILSNLPNSYNTFTFPSNTQVKVNIIKLIANSYKDKKNNNINTLPAALLSVFNGEEASLPYKHLGSYNLKIAAIIKKLKDSKGQGIISSLSIEGQLNLILALQLLDFKNFENNVVFHTSLTHTEVEKIKSLTEFIIDNIAVQHSIKSLCANAIISPAKLQLGFKAIHNKTVTEFIKHVRLEKAEYLLLNSDLNISEVVYTIGLTSRSYFCKIFKTKYNYNPTKYRNKFKSNVPNL